MIQRGLYVCVRFILLACFLAQSAEAEVSGCNPENIHAKPAVSPVGGSDTLNISAGFFDPDYIRSWDPPAQHLGVDLPGPEDSIVVSPISGRVLVNRTDRKDPFEKYLIVKSQNQAFQHVFGHINSSLKQGCDITAGDVLGTIVSAGTGPHVHWGVNEGEILSALGNGWGWGRAPLSASAQDAYKLGWIDPAVWFDRNKSGPSPETQTEYDPNLLFAEAVKLYGEALGLPQTERRTVLAEVLAIIDRIGTEFPESIPGKRLAAGRTLGPIDVAALRSMVEQGQSSVAAETPAEADTYLKLPSTFTPDWVAKVVPKGKLGNGYHHGQFPSWGERTHAGVDIGGGCGLEVRAAAGGEVVKLVHAGDRDFDAVGNAVVIDHGEISGRQSYTAYFHLKERPEVETGPIVAGARLGKTGKTGAASGCHLHFEVRHFEGVRGLYHPEWANIYGGGDKSASDTFRNDWTNPAEWFAKLEMLKREEPENTPTEATAGNASTGRWGPEIVVSDIYELGVSPCSNRTDKRACLEEKGLSEEAIDFIYEIDGDYEGGTYGTYFQELGQVDLAIYTFVGADIHRFPVLLNGPSGLIKIQGTENIRTTFRDSASQKMLKRFGKAENWRPTVYSHRVLADGTQRFVLVEDITDYCRVCPRLGGAISFLEIGPRTKNRLHRRPIGLILTGSKNNKELSSMVLKSQPASLQARLNGLGYEAGMMDGYPGPQTRQALMEFQVEHCLPPTGQPDPRTLEELVDAEGFHQPCAGRRLPEGISANTPLMSGIYVDDLNLCLLKEVPYENHHLRQRRIRGNETSWAYGNQCETERTDIRNGVTQFRGTCFDENEVSTAPWRFNVLSNDEFVDLDMPTALPRDAAPRRFRKCPDESPLRKKWSAWFGDTLTGSNSSLAPLTAAEKNALNSSILKCWNGGSLDSDALKTVVTVEVLLLQDGRPDTNSINLISYSGGSSSAAENAFEAVRRAILRCGRNGFRLPKEKYEHWKRVEVTFNPESMHIR